MITALDTSVMLAIAKGERNANSWAARLERARAEGQLIFCDVVGAELVAFFQSEERCEQFLARLNAQYSVLGWAAAKRAGQAFAEYRRRGGTREHMIPDFLIAAHALEQANRLAAIDRGFFRQCFRPLEILRN
jgi:predicted nucleic acid-binding protein